MEAILGDAMFEAPGSSVKYVLVNEAVAKREEHCVYLGRGQGGRFHALIAQEEGDWEEKQKKEREKRDRSGSFEQWRGKDGIAAGAGG
jgi:ATP-dependent Clp protease ATP-binding subunit ClpX